MFFKNMITPVVCGSPIMFCTVYPRTAIYAYVLFQAADWNFEKYVPGNPPHQLTSLLSCTLSRLSK
jgi:hypothetical protein